MHMLRRARAVAPSRSNLPYAACHNASILVPAGHLSAGATMSGLIHVRGSAVDLGFGRNVVSDIEAPNMLVNLV
jgi:hypothetical protein